MREPSPSRKTSRKQTEIDRVVEEVVADAHLDAATLRADERQYLKDHALKKPMGVLHIWALGVGVVITGEYFGWNPGLKEAGPIGMLLASLFVCALYMTWVLGLSELSVAMPFAGGPLAYGRRAVGPAFGFVMGWSMFLESLFATIGTAIATGGASTSSSTCSIPTCHASSPSGSAWFQPARRRPTSRTQPASP